jgi:hypothetical protein
MASLHAFTNNSTPLATMQVPAENGHINDIDVNSVLAKPKQDCLSVWLEKLVTGGQCSNLFVEHLSLDEISFKRIKQLCIEHKVALINLMPNNMQKSNVVKGPW